MKEYTVYFEGKMLSSLTFGVMPLSIRNLPLSGIDNE